MVKYKLIKIENGWFFYEYFPEGGTTYGIVKVRQKPFRFEVVKLSDEETEYFKWYVNHLRVGFKWQATKETLKEEGFFAWY